MGCIVLPVRVSTLCHFTGEWGGILEQTPYLIFVRHSLLAWEDGSQAGLTVLLIQQ